MDEELLAEVQQILKLQFTTGTISKVVLKTMTVIDAHQHFWELGRFAYDWLQADELSPICRTYLPEDLAPQLTQAAVDRSIFVQTQHNLAENEWILGLCEKHDFLAGMVGWVALPVTLVKKTCCVFGEHPAFLGIRHVTHDEPDDDFIVRPNILQGLRVLEKHRVPFDLLFFVRHLHHAQQLGRELPELPMVIDHLSKPEIKLGRHDNWEANFRAAAQFPNMYCKISGMVTEADWNAWSVADLRPYVEIALDAFGPERCMMGSDWPVCELAGSYGDVVGAAPELVGTLSSSETSARARRDCGQVLRNRHLAPSLRRTEMRSGNEIRRHLSRSRDPHLVRCRLRTVLGWHRSKRMHFQILRPSALRRCVLPTLAATSSQGR